MKKLVWITASIALIVNCHAQEVLRVQNGAVVTVQNNAPVTVLGGVTLENGSTLQNNGTITIKNNGPSGTGDWTDQTATGYNHGAGSLVFNGSSSQWVNSKNIFARIEVNTGGLNLATDINSTSWYLVNGTINTGSFKAIALGATANAVEADATNTGFNNSWINGTLRRYITPATVNNYVFPVGNSTLVNRAEMDNLTTDALNNITWLDAFFAPKAGTDAGLSVIESGTLYTSIHDAGIWHLIPDNQPTSGHYDLKLYVNGFSALVDNRFTILRRTEGSTNGADWMIPAGSFVNPNGGAGRMVADGFALRRNCTTFSEFGIGILNAPLPVTLVNFDALRTSIREVKLNWETKTESNNKGFDVQLRKDNEPVFITKGFVASQAPDGNSAVPLHYSFTDNNAYSGTSYYRLKQTDLDGKESYTMIKVVNGLDNATVTIAIAPNPNKGQFSIRMENVTGSKKAYIIDLKGTIVHAFVIKDQQPIYVNHLSAGTYLLSIPDAFGMGRHFKEKILIVR
jgi:hypothetical protein